MKISAIKPFPLSGGMFVKVETDEGIYGIGEAGIKRHSSAIAEMVNHLALTLIDEDPMRTEHLWQKMFRGGFFPGGKVLCSAISAIDIALWDIKAKALDVPLYQLLGGAVREKAVCYPHIGGGTTEQLVENAQRVIANGWKFLRFSVPSEGNILEPSRAVRTTIEQFEGLRQAVGDDIEICLDIHTLS